MTDLRLPAGCSRLSAALREAPRDPSLLEDWLSDAPEGGARCDIGGCGTILTRAEALNGRCVRHLSAYFRAAGILDCEDCEGSGWEPVRDADGNERMRRCSHRSRVTAESTTINRERSLQHIEPARIDPAEAVKYWSSEAIGEQWREEFEDLREHFESEGETPEGAIQRASARVLRLKSSHRIGRALLPDVDS